MKKINNDCETEGKLSKEYYKVVIGTCQNILKSENNESNKSYSPKDFNNMLSKLNLQFAKYESNDSKDLLLYLFQTFHEELNYLGDEKLKSVPKCNQIIEKESFDFFNQVNSALNLSIISYLFYGI